MNKPLCFVLMPFGRKPGSTPALDVNFDQIYEQAIRPGIGMVGMEPIRADEERTGGIIHQVMFERLILCDYALVDLTGLNANVFYELGVRHAVRPATTLAVFEKRQKLPFDLSFLRCLPYELSKDEQFDADAAGKLRDAVGKRLKELRDQVQAGPQPDSPVFQLLGAYQAPDIARLKTDRFRELVTYSAEKKSALARARETGDVGGVKAVEASLADFGDVEAGILVDLFLSYRALGAFTEMVEFYDRLPTVMKKTVLIREQYGFALNRCKRRREALEVLENVEQEQGPSSETSGLIGRVYKDFWMEARKEGNRLKAAGYLDKAIDAYVRGFDADNRDAYPGVNAVTLLDIKGDASSLDQKAELLPIVKFAVRRRLKGSKADYWDHATLLELIVLQNDATSAEQAASNALAHVRETWEPVTTANNLSLIQEARRARGVDEPWLAEIIVALRTAGKRT